MIWLSDGNIACIDDEDYEIIIQYNWSNNGNGYAYTRSNGIIQTTKMSHLVLSLHNITIPKGYEVDHEDKNRLNNQKHNLRIATKSQNHANAKLYKNNTSGFKGVYLDKKTNKWCARIHYDNTNTVLGYFSDAKDAAIAYDVAALKHFKEFASLNYPRSNYVFFDGEYYFK